MIFIESGISLSFGALILSDYSEIILAAGGIFAIFIMFFVAQTIKKSSVTKRFSQQLTLVTRTLNAEDMITEENVGSIYPKLKQLPPSIQKGWGYFLEQKIGYPSDYISGDFLSNSEYSKKNSSGENFFRITSAIIIVAVILIEFFLNRDRSLSAVGISDFLADFQLVASIIAVFCVPLITYIILNTILKKGYTNQYQQLRSAFEEFQDALNEKVVVYHEQQEQDFILENHNAIDIAAREARSMGGVELIDIVTVKPEEISFYKKFLKEESKTGDEELKESQAEIIEQRQTDKEELPINPNDDPLTEEEKQSKLEGLIAIIDQAVFADPDITENQVEELAILIESERLYGMYKDRDKEILEECLRKLARKHSSFAEKEAV